MIALQRIVTQTDAGRKLGRFVCGTMGVSSGELKRLKQRDGLVVNGEHVHADYILCDGDIITLHIEDKSGKPVLPEAGEVPIVYMDDDILILDKPAPLACQCTPRQPSGTLENHLFYHFSDREGFVFRPLNRLDKGTSGLMAVAFHPHACSLLQRQLHTDAFLREYLAVVDGELTGNGVISAPIAKEEAATIRRIVDPVNGHSAETHWKSLCTDGKRSLVQLRLMTGRTHQIRVHMSHIGHPVTGDFLYGTEIPELPGRFALHSCFLRLTHPISGETMEWFSPLPELLCSLLEIDEATWKTCLNRF